MITGLFSSTGPNIVSIVCALELAAKQTTNKMKKLFSLIYLNPYKIIL